MAEAKKPDEHQAFAESRVTQYVYVPTREHFFSTLDAHADTLEGDRKLPLVLVGNDGSGKSALLANWVAKRQEHRHRDEFLFQHFVGCTTPSLQVRCLPAFQRGRLRGLSLEARLFFSHLFPLFFRSLLLPHSLLIC